MRATKVAFILLSIVLLAPHLSPARHIVRATPVWLGISRLNLDTKGRMYCYQNVLEPGATGGGVVHVNGFTVEVKPAPDGHVPDYVTCKATILSPHGKTVFEDDDWGIEIDPITGRDVNGGGGPDVVFENFSGGAHCCWDYKIISLGSKPGLVGEFENRAPASFKDLAGDGKVEILIRDGSFDEGFGLAHPYSPFPLLIVRLNGTTFEDVGAKFWPQYEKEIGVERGKLKEKDVRAFLQLNPTEIHDDEQYFDTEYRILAIALDYLYAGRAAESRRFLNESWPKQYEEKAWGEMVDGYCSGLRSELKLAVPRSCVENLLGKKER